MFSDTHFHFSYLLENQNFETAKNILCQMAKQNVFFGMDIGTKANDLPVRFENFLKVLNLFDEKNADDKKIKTKVENFFYFSAGIWPDYDSIKNRFEKIKILEKNISDFKNMKNPFAKKLIAIGEGGLDYHWNKTETSSENLKNSENKNDFDLQKAEKELFEMQLELAKKLDLPFVIHSRDAAEETLDCIKNISYDFGILHCCSYTLAEVKKFLERGWYISFSGSVTYAKKNKLDEINSLLAYIPEDRILLETDSPYLAPVPMRGKKNNPNFVEYTYNFVAKARNICVEKLCEIVDKNCKELFSI